MENNLPPESSAAPPRSGMGGKERVPSPWELDTDWQEAPKDLKKIRPLPPTPPPAPPPAAEPAKPKIEVESAEPREAYVPRVRRLQPVPEREGSWPALICRRSSVFWVA
jgi:hypothetical protein